MLLIYANCVFRTCMYSHRRTCQPNEFNIVFYICEQKQCSMVLDQYFDGKKISFNTNIIQYGGETCATCCIQQCWTLLDNWLGVVLEVGAKNWN